MTDSANISVKLYFSQCGDPTGRRPLLSSNSTAERQARMTSQVREQDREVQRSSHALSCLVLSLT